MKKALSLLLPVIALVGLSSIFIVDETEQVVILQLGKPVKTLIKPGLNFKLPFPFQEKTLLMIGCSNTILHLKRF